MGAAAQGSALRQAHPTRLQNRAHPARCRVLQAPLTLQGVPQLATPFSCTSIIAQRESWSIRSWRGIKAGISTLLISLPRGSVAAAATTTRPRLEPLVALARFCWGRVARRGAFTNAEARTLTCRREFWHCATACSEHCCAAATDAMLAACGQECVCSRREVRLEWPGVEKGPGRCTGEGLLSFLASRQAVGAHPQQQHK